jgi:hypothetical protein
MMDWKGARKYLCRSSTYYPIAVSSRFSGKLGKTTVRINRLSAEFEHASIIMKAESLIPLEPSGSIRDFCGKHKPHTIGHFFLP